MNYDDVFFDAWMDEWRWCDTLSVVEAAMLAVELNPSDWEPPTVASLWNGRFHRIGTDNHTKNYLDSTRFVPVFRAITRAVVAEELEFESVHLARTLPTVTVGDRDFDECPQDDEEPISYDRLLAAGVLVSTNFEMPEYGNLRRFYFRREPDWERTTLKVEKLRGWIEAKGLRPKFFFPVRTPDANAFSDTAHDHFSAELDLAVKVWAAFSSEQKFPRGVKEAVSSWIEKHPDAWLGESDLSASAKDRIVTLVNWKKTGGAPSIGS